MRHLLLAFILLFSSASADVVLNVVDFGARGDASTDLSGPLARAWDLSCKSVGPTIIYIPSGKFFLSSVTFRGPCRSTIKFQIDGIIVASSSYSGLSKFEHEEWILFDNVRHVSINGGTLDGQGSGLWDCKTKGHACPAGVSNLVFNDARDIKISSLESINSKLYHIVVNRCKRVRLQGLKIIAPKDSPNTDGIHVQLSKGVSITNTIIATGDDCVSIGPGTANLMIERVACGPGHGISIGSLGKDMEEEGVENVTVRTAAFRNTQNGLRIKTWARPSKGFVKNVVFNHVSMDNVQNPILINQNYCPHNNDNIGCPNQNSGIAISHVAFNNIYGTSATAVAVKFDCSPSKPCKGIRLKDIRITNQNERAESSCNNARGIASGFVVPPSCL